MGRRVLPYREGDWVAIPQKSGGHVLGKIARVGRRGVLLLYVFGQRFHEVPESTDIPPLGPHDSVMVGKVGDLRILQGVWKVIAAREQLDRSKWVLPQFGRVETLTGRAYVVTYDESNLLVPVSEEACAPEVAKALPRDGLLGWGGVEAVQQ